MNKPKPQPPPQGFKFSVVWKNGKQWKKANGDVFVFDTYNDAVETVKSFVESGLGKDQGYSVEYNYDYPCSW